MKVAEGGSFFNSAASANSSAMRSLPLAWASRRQIGVLCQTEK